jgi:hypothetical protein
LGGGGGEEDRLAVPTDRPIVVPSRPPGSSSVTLNMSDPGYRMNGSWRVGDGWDYESDAGRVFRVRVVEQRNVSGGAHFLVEERLGAKGSSSLAVNASWIDGRSWVRLNATAPTGVGERYQPGEPLRLFRNATIGYNVTRVDAEGRTLANLTVAHYSRLRPTHQTLLFSWGYLETRVVEEIAVTRLETGQRAQANSTRWVHADYLNDVQFETPAGETFKLVSARAGDVRRGTLAP